MDDPVREPCGQLHEGRMRVVSGIARDRHLEVGNVVGHPRDDSGEHVRCLVEFPALGPQDPHCAIRGGLLEPVQLT